jgi:hypothetical protein
MVFTEGRINPILPLSPNSMIQTSIEKL